MDSFILIFKGLQEYNFHNHFALPVKGNLLPKNRIWYRFCLYIYFNPKK